MDRDDQELMELRFRQSAFEFVDRAQEAGRELVSADLREALEFEALAIASEGRYTSADLRAVASLAADRVLELEIRRSKAASLPTRSEDGWAARTEHDRPHR